MNKKMKTLIILITLIVGVFGAEEILEMQENIQKEEMNIIENKTEEKENKQEYVDTKTETKNEEGEAESVISVTDETFENEVLKSNKTVLVDFYATWCKPCQRLAPIVEEFANENKDIKVVKIDIDEARLTATDYGVNSIPTLMVIEDGEIKNSCIGLVSKEYISEMVKK